MVCYYVEVWGKNAPWISSPHYVIALIIYSITILITIIVINGNSYNFIKYFLFLTRASFEFMEFWKYHYRI